MGAAQATDTPDRTVPTPSPRWVKVISPSASMPSMRAT